MGFADTTHFHHKNRAAGDNKLVSGLFCMQGILICFHILIWLVAVWSMEKMLVLLNHFRQLNF